MAGGGLATENPVELAMAPDVAVIVTLPAARAFASPAALIVATLVLEELHVTELEIFSLEPSVNVPVAVNCWVVPAVADPLAGVIWIELRVPSTSSGVLPLMAAELPVMVAVPCPTALATPEELSVATAVFEDAQVTELVKSCTLPSL